MNRRLSTLLRRRAIVCLTTACCSAAIVSPAWAEVSPLPPGSTILQPPGQQPQPGVVPAVTATPIAKPTTAPTLPRPTAIQPAVKTATAPTAVQSAEIKAYIQTSFTRLKSDNTAAWESARADLVGGLSSPAPNTPCSPTYLNDYMQTFVPELQQLVGKDAPLAKRLNAAIVLARAAEALHAQGGTVPKEFYPLIQSEMNDKCDAIALWGMKAATAAIAAAPGVPTRPLLMQVVTCVQQHGMNGAITAEAYQALDSTQPEAIQGTLSLYKMRVAQYANGGMPSDPSVDFHATTHLTTSTGMWAKLSKTDQDQVMALICQNLMGVAAAIVKPDIQADVVEQLRTAAIKEGGAVQVVTGGDTTKSELNIAAKHLAGLSPSAPPPEVVDRINPVVSGLQAAYPGSAANAAVAKP